VTAPLLHRPIAASAWVLNGDETAGLAAAPPESRFGFALLLAALPSAAFWAVLATQIF